jgi:hypothetical protein
MDQKSELKNGAEVMRQCAQKMEAGYASSEAIFLHSCLPRLFQTSEENFISMV